MGDALFYHLTRSPAESLIPTLIGKSLAAGWRVEVRGQDPARMDWLDKQLWQGDGFLPHGLAGGPHDSDQLVLLTVGTGNVANNPTCLITIDGADIDPSEHSKLHRSCIVFDGGSADAVALARTQWSALASAGVSAQYWSEESGRWQQKR